MWYFSWILGLGLALSFAILNGLWHELRRYGEDFEGAPGLDEAG